MIGWVIALLIVLMLSSIYLIQHARDSEKVSRVKELIQFLDDGLTLAKPLEVEFGILRAHGYYSSGRHPHYKVNTEFSVSSSGLVDKIKYSDLCSNKYFLGVEKKGVGYLVAPAVKIVSHEFSGVVILCLDPSRVPEFSKSIVGEEGIKSELFLRNGRYVVKASWVVSTPTQWRVIYDKKKGVYTITTAPEGKSRVGSAAVKLCVTKEVCNSILELQKPGEEVVKEVESLQERKIIITHLNLINLAEIASSAGVTTYPHISGYAEGMIRVKLIHKIPLAKDVIVEEVI
ncbi:MAG: hypothetical protein QN229_05220 [Desulfurococcaceae archaeon TW002]